MTRQTLLWGLGLVMWSQEHGTHLCTLFSCRMCCSLTIRGSVCSLPLCSFLAANMQLPNVNCPRFVFVPFLVKLGGAHLYAESSVSQSSSGASTAVRHSWCPHAFFLSQPPPTKTHLHPQPGTTVKPAVHCQDSSRGAHTPRRESPALSQRSLPLRAPCVSLRPSCPVVACAAPLLSPCRQQPGASGLGPAPVRSQQRCLQQPLAPCPWQQGLQLGGAASDCPQWRQLCLPQSGPAPHCYQQQAGPGRHPQQHLPQHAVCGCCLLCCQHVVPELEPPRCRSQKAGLRQRQGGKAPLWTQQGACWLLGRLLMQACHCCHPQPRCVSLQD